MANVGPIQIFSNLSNQATLPELVRFVSAFAGQVSQQFTNLLSQRLISGAVGTTGNIVAGQNFGASLVTTGNYWIAFSPKFTERPAVLVNSETSTSVRAFGVTTTGFSVTGAANTAFSFLARGDN